MNTIFIQRDRFAYLMEIMAFQLSLIIDAHHEKNLPSRYDTIKSMIYRYKKNSRMREYYMIEARLALF